MAPAKLAALAIGAALGALVGATVQAQVPAQRAADPAASLMTPAPATTPGGRWTVVQVQQSFQAADANGDNQLTRAESQQLAILPRSFEDLDANKDGVLTRAEYEAGVM